MRYNPFLLIAVQKSFADSTHCSIRLRGNEQFEWGEKPTSIDLLMNRRQLNRCCNILAAIKVPPDVVDDATLLAGRLSRQFDVDAAWPVHAVDSSLEPSEDFDMKLVFDDRCAVDLYFFCGVEDITFGITIERIRPLLAELQRLRATMIAAEKAAP